MLPDDSLTALDGRRPLIEDDLKNEDDLKKEDDLKNEDNLKNEHDLKNEDTGIPILGIGATLQTDTHCQ